MVARYVPGMEPAACGTGDFTCPDCGNASYEVTQAARDHWPIYKCVACGFAFLEPSRHSNGKAEDSEPLTGR
jgi:predicted RNA-binding Zn-ribbon protein involved in translation (DUF1610 family)